jgi:hypothetical protein
MPIKPDLTQAVLRALLDYDPTTGLFTWKWRDDVRPQWNGRYAGKEAGYDWTAGPNVTYRSIRIFDWPFLAHRLAFLYVTGEWPPDAVDHMDMDGLNNRWSNLRPATKEQNAANTRATRNNRTGFKGVSPSPNGKYRATIHVDGKQRWLGTYATAEEAHTAYAQAAVAKSGLYARLK